MTTPQILNLDDLVTVKKVVKLDGFQHVAVEMTVESYLERLAEAKRIEADRTSQEVTLEDKMHQAVSFVDSVFPTITTQRLKFLTLKQLTALITYAMAAPEDVAEGVEKSAGNA